MRPEARLLIVVEVAFGALDNLLDEAGAAHQPNAPRSGVFAEEFPVGHRCNGDDFIHGVAQSNRKTNRVHGFLRCREATRRIKFARMVPTVAKADEVTTSSPFQENFLTAYRWML